MLAAPEFIEAERVDLLDEIEIAAELQHRMLADRMMRGEEGSKLQACHGFLSGRRLFLLGGGKLRGRTTHGNCVPETEGDLIVIARSTRTKQSSLLLPAGYWLA